MSRRIAIITGTRAEYGLLYWAMHELQSRGVDVQLIVTGAHLSSDHGMTVKQIEADGWKIADKVDMQLTSDLPVAIARSMGRAVSGIAEALDRIKPDIAVILGDRYEMLAAATAATIVHVPVAHLNGGEVTEGAMDDSIRHAITKLSYWHFPSTEVYAKRIIQLGEEPSRVFVVGSSGIDNMARLKLLSREELATKLDVPLDSPVILFTYHPETLSTISVEQQIATVIASLEKFPNATLLLTGANADAGGREINKALQSFATNRPRTLFRMSFGSLLYLSAMRVADVVVGNSSSGIIETPALGKPTVDIGARQAGRIKAPSVISCECTVDAIMASITKALSPEFQQSLTPSKLFGVPGKVSTRIAEHLATLEIPTSLRKPFHDVEGVNGV